MKKTFILAIAILSTTLFMSCESSDVKEARQKVSEFVKAEKEKGLATPMNSMASTPTWQRKKLICRTLCSAT